MIRGARANHRRARRLVRAAFAASFAACFVCNHGFVETAGAAVAPSPYARRTPYEIRARWVGDGRLSPASIDFDFRTIRFVPGRGVIAAGDRLLLRIDTGVPFVTLGWSRGTLGVESAGRTLTGLPNGDVLFAGHTVEADENGMAAVTTKGYLVRLGAHGWSTEEAPVLPDAASWRIVELQSTTRTDVFALVEISRSSAREDGPRSRVLRRADQTWTALDCPTLATSAGSRGGTAAAAGASSDMVGDAGCKQITGICASGADALWAVSVDRSQLATRPPAPARAHLYEPGAGWTTTAIPDGSMHVASASAGVLACDREGAWLSAYRAVPGRGMVPALYRLGKHASPSPVELPPGSDGADAHRRAGHRRPTARVLAVDRSLRPWLSVEASTEASGRTFRREGSRWREFALPAIPGVSRYHLAAMAFDAQGDGWAVANAGSGASTGRHVGLVLRFRDERWVQRGWSWSWWRERFFGLLGPDR